MATTEEKNEADAKQLRNIRQRESLSNAYAALLGEQNIQSFTAFTFEEGMDALIEDIEGEDSEIHPNQLKRVERIRGNLLKAVAEIREIKPEEFVLKNEEEDVNTPPTTA
jgi:hypothetical protein